MDIIQNLTQLSRGGHTTYIKDTLFLINDNHNEIKQHYVYTIYNPKKIEEVASMITRKKKLCENNNIYYNFCVIPDKSLCLSHFFEGLIPSRFVDDLKRKIPIVDCYDFLKNKSKEEMENIFYKTDSHMNMIGLEMCANYINNKIFNTKYNFKFNEIACNNSNFFGDLTTHYNYNMELDASTFVENTIKYTKNNYIKYLNFEDIDYGTTHGRTNFITINEKSDNNMKVLVLGDSSAFNVHFIYAEFFKETHFIWDRLHFPYNYMLRHNFDHVLEIRTERFIINHEYHDYNEYIAINNATFDLNINRHLNLNFNTILRIFFLKCVEYQKCENFNKILMINNNIEKIKNIVYNYASKLTSDELYFFKCFDHISYADSYDDLKKIFGYDELKLLDHYLCFGMNEKRIFPYPNFENYA